VVVSDSLERAMVTIRRLVLLSMVLTAACSQEVVTNRTQVSAATADSATTHPAPVTNGDASGSYQTVLYSEHDVMVVARTDGVVRTIGVELGDGVEADQELARLDDDSQQAAVAAATAAADYARKEHGRLVELRKHQAVTQADLDRALYQLQSAEAALNQAQVALEHTRVRAPFAGAVAHRYVRVGQRVAQGDTLFRVTARRPLRARVQVGELQAVGLHVGNRASVRGVDGTTVEGAITRVAPAVDPASGTVEVIVDVPHPGDLRPGSSVVVTLGPDGRSPPAPDR
jgi:RND family efflux transporter MFP subunit